MTRGEKFEREPCAKCGETLFYVSNRKCVTCSNKWSLADGKARRALNPPGVIGRPLGPKNAKQAYNKKYQEKLKSKIEAVPENETKLNDVRRNWLTGKAVA